MPNQEPTELPDGKSADKMNPKLILTSIHINSDYDITQSEGKLFSGMMHEMTSSTIQLLTHTISCLIPRRVGEDHTNTWDRAE